MTTVTPSLFGKPGVEPAGHVCAFFVAGRPATQGSKRGFVNPKTKRVILVDDNSERTRDWRAQVADAAAKAMDGREMTREAVKIRLEFRISRPKGHYGTGRNARVLKGSAPERHTQKPDSTKLQRCAEDALKGIVWHDDSQVDEITTRKRWAEIGEQQGVMVTVKR